MDLAPNSNIYIFRASTWVESSDIRFVFITEKLTGPPRVSRLLLWLILRIGMASCGCVWRARDGTRMHENITIKWNVSAHNILYRSSCNVLFICPPPLACETHRNTSFGMKCVSTIGTCDTRPNRLHEQRALTTKSAPETRSKTTEILYK